MEYSDTRRYNPSTMPHFLQDLHSHGESDVYPSTWPVPSATQTDPSAPPKRYAPDPALFVTPEKPSLRKVQQNHVSTVHEVPLRFTSMLDDDETGEPRVRFNQMVNVKEVSPDRFTDDTDGTPAPKALSIDQIQADIVRLSSLPNSSSTSGRQQGKAARNLPLKHSTDKQYSYPLSNFMKDSSSVTVDSVHSKSSPPRKIASLKSRESRDPGTAFESMGSKDFMTSDDDEVSEITVEREPQPRLQTEHHVWADPTGENVEIETVLPEGCTDRPWENPVSSFGASKKSTTHSHIKVLDTGECVLTRPEFNSTLWMNADLQQLKDSELDLTGALEQKLKMPKTKTKVAEKVYTRLNVLSPAFPSSPLVGVNVTEEDIIDRVSKQKAAKSKPTHKRKIVKAEDRLKRKPDLMEYFTPDLQKESACLTLRSAPIAPIGLSAADMERTFDLYKHVRSWEGW